MRVVRAILAIILLLVVCVIGVVVYTLSSENGLKQVLTTAQRFTPGSLTWGQASGNLLGPLSLTDIEYSQDDGLTFKSRELLFDWSAKSLLSKTIQVERLEMAGIEIHLPKPSLQGSTTKKGEITLPQIKLPFKINIGIVSLKEIKLYPYGDSKPLEANSLLFSGSSNGQTATIKQLIFTSKDADLYLTGKLETASSYPMEFNLNWDFRTAQYGDFRGHGHIQGDMEEIVLTHRIDGALEVDTRSFIFNVLNSPSWKGEIDVSVKSLGFVAPELVDSPLRLTAKTEGSLKHFESEGMLDTRLNETGPLAVSFDIEGDLKQIGITSVILKLLESNSTMSINGFLNIESKEADLRGNWQSVRWPILGDKSDIQSPNAEFSLVGSANKFIAKANMQLLAGDSRHLTTDLTLTGENDALSLTNLTLREQASSTSINATARYDIKQKSFIADANWSDLAWPTLEKPQIEINSGELNASGKVTDFEFSLISVLSGEGIPKGEWKFVGHGDDRHLGDFKLTGHTLEGEIVANGNVQWLPNLQWNALLNAHDINPEEIASQAMGKLDFSITTEGEINAEKTKITAQLKDLGGSFRGQSVTGSGTAEVINDEVRIRHFIVKHANNTIDISGVLGNAINFRWDFNSPDLSTILPVLEGNVNAMGTLSGTSEKPKFAANIDANKFKNADLSFENIKAQFDIDVSGNKRSHFKVQGYKITAAEQVLEQILLEGNGKPGKHRVEADIKSELANVRLNLSGGLNNNFNSWSGTLNDFAILDTEFGNWKQEKHATIVVSQEKVVISELCLISDPSNLCAQGQWNTSSGLQGQLKASKINSEKFQNYIPENIKLDVSLNAEAHARINGSGSLTAGSTLILSPGLLTLGTGEERLEIELSQGTAKATMDGHQTNSSLQLELGTLGFIESDVSISNLSSNNTILKGSLKSEINDLSGISVFVPQLQEITGTITSDLNFSGALISPDISGQFELTGFSTEIPEVAIKIENTFLKITSVNGEPLALDAKSQSGEGSIALVGELDPASKKLSLTLLGDSFQIANSKKLQAVINPALEITMNTDGMSVTGEVVIPSAYVNAKSGNDELKTTANSNDVVFIQEDGQLPPEKEKQNLNLDINIVLGDDIRIEAGDFKGALKGQLQVKQTPELAASGTGTIEVVNGDYVLYGQQLQITKGKILFSGGPVDNPKLDMDVAREVPAYDVVAGAKILGTAQAPILQLYSEPSMPDASILSFILLGQPAGTTGGSYTVGKYLTPDLYVSYGIGLFNAANTFNMKYKLTEQFALQAASSTDSSADIVYTLEQ